jgi:hypothetical protein
VPPTQAPVPKPDICKWNVTDNIGKTRILAEMAVQLSITYDTLESTVSNVCKPVPCIGL